MLSILLYDSVMQHVPTGLCVVSVASRHGPGVYWVMSSKKILKMNIILLCKNIEKLFKIAEKCDRSRLRRENTELKLYIKLLCKTYVPTYLRYNKISFRKYDTNCCRLLGHFDHWDRFVQSFYIT